MRTKDLRPGDPLVISYGNGTQIFLVAEVTPRGAVIGWRRYGGLDVDLGLVIPPPGQRPYAGMAGWSKARLKVNDARIQGLFDGLGYGAIQAIKAATGVEIPLDLDLRRREVAFD